MNEPTTPSVPAQEPLALEPPRNEHLTPSLSKALLEAQRAASPVDKDGTNDYHHYDYTTADAMIDSCRQLLHEQGITARRGSWTWTIVDRREAVVDNGQLVVKPCITANVQQTFTLEHAETGEKIVEVVQYPAVEEAGKPMDKSVAASLTTSWSYWLRDQLMIPRISKNQDDRDDRKHGDQRQPKKQNGGGSQQRKPNGGGGGQQPKAAPKQLKMSTKGKPITQDSIKAIKYAARVSGPNSQRKWELDEITTDSGVRYATFDRKISQAAKEFEGTGEACWIEYELTDRGQKMLQIKAVPANATPPQTPPAEQLAQEEPGANG